MMNSNHKTLILQSISQINKHKEIQMKPTTILVNLLPIEETSTSMNKEVQMQFTRAIEEAIQYCFDTVSSEELFKAIYNFPAQRELLLLKPTNNNNIN